MKIVSKTHTNDLGDGPIEPGTAFECGDAAAREKIAAGRARGADEEPLTGNAPDRLEAITDAIVGLDEEDESLWMGDGRPKVEAVTAAFGASVTADERDAAWASLQD